MVKICNIFRVGKRRTLVIVLSLIFCGSLYVYQAFKVIPGIDTLNQQLGHHHHHHHKQQQQKQQQQPQQQQQQHQHEQEEHQQQKQKHKVLEQQLQQHKEEDEQKHEPEKEHQQQQHQSQSLGSEIAFYSMMSEIFFLDCPKTLATAKDVSTASELMKKWTDHLSDKKVLKRVNECKMEPDDNLFVPEIPVAFGITLHETLGALEMLLHLVSLPGHTVCIHVDAKAKDSFRSKVAKLIDCYQKKRPNTTIFLVPDPVATRWGHISLLDSDLKCIEHSLARSDNWQYFLNVASTSLPSVGMDVIDNKLKKLDGKSITCSDPLIKGLQYRIKCVHHFEEDVNEEGHHEEDICVPKTSPPHNLTIYQSFREAIINRTFAQFALEHPVAKSLHSWLSDTFCPDELFFSTLNRLRLSSLENNNNNNNNLVQVEEDECPVNARYTLWYRDETDGVCHGEVVRTICQFSLADLPNLTWKADEALFMNKFNINMDAVAAACWGESVGDHHLVEAWKP